jgi:uncharacterized cupin superfamily protein
MVAETVGSAAGVTPVLNIADVALRAIGHGEKFAAQIARVGALIGSRGLGCTLVAVPPGKRAFPFHNHHVTHELFFVLAGSGEYRFGAATYPIRAGDVVAAPAGGAETAHQLVNTGDGELRYLAFSDSVGSGPEVVEYPDSAKFAMFSHSPDATPMTARIRYIGRVESSLDYWDGE